MKFPMIFSGIPVPISEEFPVEEINLDNKIVKLYRWFAVFFDDGKEKVEANKRYFESKTWIDNQGIIIKEEYLLEI